MIFFQEDKIVAYDSITQYYNQEALKEIHNAFVDNNYLGPVHGGFTVLKAPRVNHTVWTHQAPLQDLKPGG